jgi:hypothetical protein
MWHTWTKKVAHLPVSRFRVTCKRVTGFEPAPHCGGNKDDALGARPDFQRVVFHPAGTRVNLLVLFLVVAGDLALRTLLNEKISIELTWEQLERILNQSFRHVNCYWHLPKETVTTSRHGLLVRSESAAVAWLEHVLPANLQT